ncbi:hypothetical protein AADZ90_007215 [Aestuariibius sp. 2305UL40-4]|uniref:hypothetical protein n=1 Tax=Aestuariibius violaceus TaxID=3234132 RepID=UPI00345EC9AC
MPNDITLSPTINYYAAGSRNTFEFDDARNASSSRSFSCGFERPSASSSECGFGKSNPSEKTSLAEKISDLFIEMVRDRLEDSIGGDQKNPLQKTYDCAAHEIPVKGTETDTAMADIEGSFARLELEARDGGKSDLSIFKVTLNSDDEATSNSDSVSDESASSLPLSDWFQSPESKWRQAMDQMLRNTILANGPSDTDEQADAAPLELSGFHLKAG